MSQRFSCIASWDLFPKATQKYKSFKKEEEETAPDMDRVSTKKCKFQVLIFRVCSSNIRILNEPKNIEFNAIHKETFSGSIYKSNHHHWLRKKVNKLRSHVKLREAEIEVIINTNWILRKRDFLTFSVVLFACMVNQHDVQLNSNPSEPEPRILNRPSISRNSNKR